MKDFIQNVNMLFYNFISKYDTSNPNIVRKIIHSFSVAEKCFSIACNLKLSFRNKNIAYLAGLLHDTGRFEQWRLYHTFNDFASVDHGDLSAKIIKNLEIPDISPKEKSLISVAVKYHTKDYKGTNKQVKLLNKIVTNADAYANIISTATGAQPITGSDNGFSSKLFSAFMRMEPLISFESKTKLDRALKLTSLVYFISFNFLRKEIHVNNYIDVICDTLIKHLSDQDQIVYKNAIDNLKKYYIKNNT